MSRRLGLALSAALAATVVVAAPAHADVTMIELGGIEGSTRQSAWSINDAGVAVGESRYDDGSARAVRYGTDGTVKEIAGPAGTSTSARSINATGHVAGSSYVPSVRGSAVRFNPDGTRLVLGSVWGYSRASGQAIDENRNVYGLVFNPESGPYLPVKWDTLGRATVLQMPAGMTTATITGASNGYASGSVWGTASDPVAVRWNPDGTVTVLTRLSERGASYARGVNRHGEVVGETFTEGNFAVLGVRWGADGSIITRYGANTHPRGLNDHGVAVGYEITTDYVHHPMRWTTTGEALELPRPSGATRASGADINNNGVIVGYTGDELSPQRALKWTVS
ncbi:hypothetical protein LFM09_48440 [Lentzea alba]|uniref:hypothetical protein n=1 Tax=Lentzea alba TaxID=2714351 RepID=UPI0039BF274D